VILGFGDATTKDIFHGSDTKAARILPKDLWTVARRKLDMLDAAHVVSDLREPPGNRLERLKGDLAGFWSARVNDQHRLIFAFAAGNATDVRITDYH
jgi:proteic killer suppression protein